MPPRGGRGRRRCRAGRGRSRPSSKSCETLGASSHVSRRFPFSRPRPAPRPARGPPSASRPGGETLRPAPDPPRPSSACGHGSRRKPLFLSAVRLGGSVRGASPQSPRPVPDQGDSRLPIPSPHAPGRPPASATRPDPSGIPPSWAATLSTSAIAPDPKPRPRGPGPRGGFRTAPDVRLPPPTCLSFLKPSPAPAVHHPKGPGASPPGWRPSPRARLHAPTHIRNLAGPQST